MSIDEDRLVEIGMAAYHRVSVAMNLYHDLTPSEGRVPYADLPECDRQQWLYIAQCCIDSGEIDMTTHRPKLEARHADH